MWKILKVWGQSVENTKLGQPEFTDLVSLSRDSRFSELGQRARNGSNRLFWFIG